MEMGTIEPALCFAQNDHSNMFKREKKWGRHCDAGKPATCDTGSLHVNPKSKLPCVLFTSLLICRGRQQSTA